MPIWFEITVVLLLLWIAASLSSIRAKVAAFSSSWELIDLESQDAPAKCFNPQPIRKQRREGGLHQ